jgi:hypothetical protein
VQGAELPLDVPIYDYSFQVFHSFFHLCVEKLCCLESHKKTTAAPCGRLDF